MSSRRKIIGWTFPPTNGGRIDGYNDPGISIFDGSRLRSLARETVQNSMDARIPSSRGPVNVTFELKKLSCRKEFHLDSLAKHCRACLDHLGTSTDNKAKSFFKDALVVLKDSNNGIWFLCVSDRNTTGLRGEHWKALVKMQGTSVKDDLGAGGSFGIGKYAPFATSALRTVGYWTSFTENGKITEIFQGKSVLMSHKFGRQQNERQGTGFFGIKDGCCELTGTDIPIPFRLSDRNGDLIQGTAIWISGVSPESFSRMDIAQSVIESFFNAIDANKLVVVLEPADDGDEFQEMEISSGNLGRWIDHLLGSNPKSKELRIVKTLRNLMKSRNPDVTLDDSDLGLCKLWIRVDDSLQRSVVGLLRGTGMLITTNQPRLIRFPGLRSFASVCMFDSEEGNSLLRQMENPQHNEFQPERLPKGDRIRGKKALQRVSQWIREQIRKRAARHSTESSDELPELARFLPDTDSPTPLSSSSSARGDESDFDARERRILWRPRRSRLRARQRAFPPADSSEGGDGDELGQEGGQGGGTGQGDRKSVGHQEGEGIGGSGTRGGNIGRVLVELEDVRVLPSKLTSDRYRVSFTPRKSARVHVHIAEEGDSVAYERDDIAAYRVVDQQKLSLKSIDVVKGERFEFEMTGRHGSFDSAWRITATEEKTA